MYELVKPNGFLIVQENDFRTWSPISEPEKEIRRVIFAVLGGSGRDVNIGSKLPSLLMQAGIGRPDGTRVDGLLTTDVSMALSVYQTLLPIALKLSITTEEASRAVIHEWNLEQDGSRYYLWPLCIGAWKRKPV
jgi:hypothetical protein